MTRPTLILLFATLAALLSISAVSLASIHALRAPPPIPSTPVAPSKLFYARPFRLVTAYEHRFRAEKPRVNSGYLIVLRADPALLYPRQVAEPVLYLGKQTAEKINIGYASGHLVAIVPAALDGDQKLDLAAALFFFGNPALPEQVDAAHIDQQHRLAHHAGIAPIPAPDLAAALKLAGDPLALPDVTALLREAAALIDRFAPDEAELAEHLRSNDQPIGPK